MKNTTTDDKAKYRLKEFNNDFILNVIPKDTLDDSSPSVIFLIGCAIKEAQVYKRAKESITYPLNIIRNNSLGILNVDNQEQKSCLVKILEECQKLSQKDIKSEQKRLLGKCNDEIKEFPSFGYDVKTPDYKTKLIKLENKIDKIITTSAYLKENQTIYEFLEQRIKSSNIDFQTPEIKTKLKEVFNYYKY